MLFYTRKTGSQRTSVPQIIIPELNWAGRDGTHKLVFRMDKDNTYIVIEPESDLDVRNLMSHAHIIFRNFPDRPKDY